MVIQNQMVIQNPRRNRDMVHAIYFYDGPITDEVKKIFINILLSMQDMEDDDYVRWITLDGSAGWGLNWKSWMTVDEEPCDIAVLTNNPDYLSPHYLSEPYKGYNNIFLYDFGNERFAAAMTMIRGRADLKTHFTARDLFIDGFFPEAVNPGVSADGTPLRNPKKPSLSKLREIADKVMYNDDSDDEKNEKK